MSNFPLYDNLYSETKDITEDLTVKQKDEFMKLIKNIDLNGCELIYALIRTYQLDNSEDKTTFKLPYNGIYVGDELEFNYEGLPIQLKIILYRFIKMHEKTLSETKE